MLQFTRKVEYGLAILAYMTRHPGQPGASAKDGKDAEDLHSARAISEALRIPFDMVTKCLQRMAKTGLCRAMQGKHGGYALSCDLHSLSLGKFVQLFSDSVAIVECLGTDHPTCAQHATCALVTPMQRLNARFLALLNGMSLADFLGLEQPAASPAAN
jgi:Rrf2 family transcriptional regulator, nitric oxide-sensitive transcriptional repressor